MAMVATPAKAIQGFDCTHPEITFQAVNLAEIAACPNADLDYARGAKEYVRIIQASDTVEVQGFQCRLLVTKAITRCSWDRGLTYGTTHPLWNAIIPLDARSCVQAIQDGVVVYENHNIKFRIGELQKETWFTHGTSLGTNGKCKWTEEIISEGITYPWATQNIQVEFLGRQVRGELDTVTGKVTFPLLRLTAHYDLQTLSDFEQGTVVWKDTAHDCRESISQLYKGEAWLYRRKEYINEWRDAILLINNTETNQFAGLVMKGSLDTCGDRCYSTHILGLVVCPYVVGTDQDKNGNFKASSKTLLINLQSQTGYLHITTNLNVWEAFRNIQAAICAVDRKVLGNKIQAIAGESTPYALMDLYGPGYTSYIAGAVAYMTHCVPVQVQMRQHENCTQEIPVVYNEKLVFMDPINRILQPYPTIIPCSDLMQVKWFINGNWMCSSPQVTKCDAPHTLLPLAPSTVEIDFTTGMGKSVYSKEQLEAHRRYDAQLATRGPAVANLAHNAALGSGNGKLGSYLGTIDMDNIEATMTPRLFPTLYWLGDAWHYLSGLGMVYIALKLIVGLVIRLYALYTRRGIGWWLLGAITDTTFQLALFPVTIITSIFRTASGDQDDPPPDYQRHGDNRASTAMTNLTTSRPDLTRETPRSSAPTAPPEVSGDAEVDRPEAEQAEPQPLLARVRRTLGAHYDVPVRQPYNHVNDMLTRDRFRVNEEELRTMQQQAVQHHAEQQLLLQRLERMERIREQGDARQEQALRRNQDHDSDNEDTETI